LDGAGGVTVGVGVEVGVGVGGGVEIKMNLDMLGMPFTKAVTSASPEGKSLIGCEVKVVSERGSAGSGYNQRTSWLSLLRSCIRG
jgi:hypothetical protein